MARLIKKTFLPYEGKVHDLTVDNSHTYNVEGLGVHNSAGGSLLAYVLNITQMDPIKHDLLFERFMTRKKKCLALSTYVMTLEGPKTLRELNVGESVKTHTTNFKPVVYKDTTEHTSFIEITTEDGTSFQCSPTHWWVVVREGRQMEVMANELVDTDELIEML